MIKCQILGSGSKGNCVVVEINNNLFLLDAGLGIRKTKKYLKDYWHKSIKDLKAVFITHEHKDHTKIIPQLKKQGVYILQPQTKHLKEIILTDKFSNTLQINIDVIPADHDVFCVNYRITDVKKNLSLLYITDTGTILCDALKYMIEPCDIIICEMNHDVSMMLNNDRYPDDLKIRIDETHLSNEQAHDLLSLIATPRLKYFCAYHLSEHNNNKQLAEYEAKSALKQICPECKIIIAEQDNPSEIMMAI